MIAAVDEGKQDMESIGVRTPISAVLILQLVPYCSVSKESQKGRKENAQTGIQAT